MLYRKFGCGCNKSATMKMNIIFLFGILSTEINCESTAFISKALPFFIETALNLLTSLVVDELLSIIEIPIAWLFKRKFLIHSNIDVSWWWCFVFAMIHSSERNWSWRYVYREKNRICSYVKLVGSQPGANVIIAYRAVFLFRSLIPRKKSSTHTHTSKKGGELTNEIHVQWSLCVWQFVETIEIATRAYRYTNVRTPFRTIDIAIIIHTLKECEMAERCCDCCSSQIQTHTRAHFTRTNGITGFISIAGHDEVVLAFNNNTNNSKICASGTTLTFPHASDRVMNDKSSIWCWHFVISPIRAVWFSCVLSVSQFRVCATR